MRWCRCRVSARSEPLTRVGFALLDGVVMSARSSVLDGIGSREIWVLRLPTHAGLSESTHAEVCGFGMIEACGPSSEALASEPSSSTTNAAPSDPGAALAKLRTKFQELCYGYPIDLIAQWCCVDLKTARHYKAGTRRPGRAALTLFALHLDGAILPAEWRGFSFRGGLMWDPYGKPLSHGVLRAYQLGVQLMREWARGDAERTRTLDEILYAPHARTLLPPPAPERSNGLSGGEAEPSDLVRATRPETIRIRNLRRPKTARRSAALKTGSTKVEGRSKPATGNARRKADPFAALSPHLRAAANAAAK